ncbi:MAG TPA: hypothetical protein VMB03_00785 [Bryobacteraceae bacterium]|nr:hypothetical protein [Bryobacteraceae bacterium]
MQEHVLNLLMGSAGALVLSAAARALPAPTAMGSRFYAWFYQFTHLLLANFDKVEISNDIQSGGH